MDAARHPRLSPGMPSSGSTKLGSKNEIGGSARGREGAWSGEAPGQGSRDHKTRDQPRPISAGHPGPWRFGPGCFRKPAPAGAGTALMPRLFGRDRRLHDVIWLADRAALALTALDPVNTLHPIHHLADDGVLAVQMRGRRKHDEELRIGRVRILGAGHADRAALERRIRELGRQIAHIRAARACARAHLAALADLAIANTT